jgi:hypothetical protein
MMYAPKPYEKVGPKKKNNFVLAAANRSVENYVGAGNCWQLLATAGNCWQLLATAGNCRQLPATAGNCWQSTLTVEVF